MITNNPTPAKGPYYQNIITSVPCRPYLFQQQLPINPHRRPAIFFTILSESPTHLAHPLEAIPPIQEILNVLRHHLGHIFQFVIQPIQVGRCPTILVCFPGALDERVKFHERVGSLIGGVVGRLGVGGGEFCGEVGEVGEGQFAGVACG